MSVLLTCDMCRLPKDSTRHMALYESFIKDGKSRHRVKGSLDICADCVAKHTHDGRESAHKSLSEQRRRLEFGKGSR